jgi:hypothetical protein
VEEEKRRRGEKEKRSAKPLFALLFSFSPLLLFSFSPLLLLSSSP